MRANNSRALVLVEARTTVPPAPASTSPTPTSSQMHRTVARGGRVHTPAASAEVVRGSAAQLVEISKSGFARAMSHALQKCYPDHHKVADDAGATSAAAKNWWLGRNAPDGYHYYCLIAMNPALPMAIQFAMDAELRAQPGYDRNVARVLADAAEAATGGGACGQE